MGQRSRRASKHRTRVNAMPVSVAMILATSRTVSTDHASGTLAQNARPVDVRRYGRVLLVDERFQDDCPRRCSWGYGQARLAAIAPMQES
jgi:hypothetical protein